MDPRNNYEGREARARAADPKKTAEVLGRAAVRAVAAAIPTLALVRLRNAIKDGDVDLAALMDEHLDAVAAGKRP